MSEALTPPPTAASWFGRLVAATAGYTGSTRPIALLRIALPLLVWAEYGRELIIPRDPHWAVRLIALSVFASTAMLLVGWRSRIAAVWVGLSLALLFGVVGHFYERDYFVHHHSFLLILLAWLLALTPCGASYSLDRWWAVRQTRRSGVAPPPEHGALWGQRLMCVNMSTVYFWTAFDKCNPAFLSGARLEHFFMSFFGGSDYPDIPGFHVLCVIGAWGTIGLELFLVVGLWMRRTRPYAAIVGILFHIALYLTLPVSTFTMITIVVYLAYFDPDEVHRVIEELQGHEPAPAAPS